MWIVGLGLVIGLIVGAMIGHDLWIIGAAAGALAGWAISSKLTPDRRLAETLAAVSSEVKDLSRRLAAVEARLSIELPPAIAPRVAIPEPGPEATATPVPTPVPRAAPETFSARETPVSEPIAAAEPPRFTQEAAAEPNPVMKWLLGGNTV